MMSENVEKFSKKGLRTSYVSTIIGISLVLFLVGLIAGAMFGLKTVQTQAKEELQGDIFFNPELNISDIKQIQLELASWPEFKSVFFVSSDKAMDEFTGDELAKKQILSIFEQSNPLPPTIGYKPKEVFANKEGMAKLKTKIQKFYPDEVQEIHYDKESVEKINLGFKQFVLLFLAVAGLLIIVAVAMINNTIRLALYSKRFTIKTMQLVGATSSFIRKPFLLNSIWQGLLSAILGMLILVGLFVTVNNFLESIEIPFDLKILSLLFLVQLVTGIIITFVSTWFSLNKYLRMKLDDLY
jgi:cell division transport system permease protein